MFTKTKLAILATGVLTVGGGGAWLEAKADRANENRRKFQALVQEGYFPGAALANPGNYRSIAEAFWPFGDGNDNYHLASCLDGQTYQAHETAANYVTLTIINDPNLGTRDLNPSQFQTVCRLGGQALQG